MVFAGTPQFAVPALRELLASRAQVVGVLTQPDRPAGRGRALRASAVKAYALQSGLPVAQPATLKTDEGRAALVDWRPELLVVVAYGLILPPEVLALPRRGCLNIHASLLPRWRGAAPIQRAILAGDRETGVAIMQLEEGLDTGPVLLERRIAIGPHDTAGDLQDRLAELGAVALLATIDGLLAGTLVPRPQPTEGVSYARKIDKSEARIDWQTSASAIDRQIRAFNPQPIAETTLHGELLRIHRARVVTESDAPHAEANVMQSPGQLLGLRGDVLLVACGAGVLGIETLQRAGKRAVSARDFVNARPVDGARLGT
ncbi:MAG TPA: methionyl-tRNA formyltransferase [Steroidobacteraceae bacterium]|nr:methionyl-tRNA formyltransferase [Steroidobacteraceae bacterium]